MNTDILKNGGPDNREINTDSLKVYGNCLEFKDTVVQLSNVSLIANNPLVTTQFPRWTILGILLGFACLFVKVGAVIISGFLLMGVSCYYIFAWNMRVDREKQLKKLVIATNSGQTFSILFEKGDFLNKVVNALTEIIAHPDHHSDIIINIKDNTIAPGGRVIDSVNEINSIGGRR